ncbi:hypothetical protein B0H16DRAFT_1712549 [Mycena metata]|uniref:RNase III domain-containing protein n=1 Tax=Mycena metata TaxID=1033252 RepID=A0AAD7K139_9AGAR|nr:hypothetical protein B0H16DRAFT_1712549 [Mycena metata]
MYTVPPPRRTAASSTKAAGEREVKAPDPDSPHEKAAAAARATFHRNNPRPLPPVDDPQVAEAIYGTSHLARSGLEYLGDRVMYLLAALSIIRVIPHLPELFHTALSALTCNRTLGELGVVWGIHRRTVGKDGGDAIETIIGGLLKSLKRRGYRELLEAVVDILREPILAIAAELAGPKRKRQEEDKLVKAGRDKTGDTSHPSKRPRIAAASSSHVSSSTASTRRAFPPLQSRTSVSVPMASFSFATPAAASSRRNPPTNASTSSRLPTRSAVSPLPVEHLHAAASPTAGPDSDPKLAALFSFLALDAPPTAVMPPPPPPPRPAPVLNWPVALADRTNLQPRPFGLPVRPK